METLYRAAWRLLGGLTLLLLTVPVGSPPAEAQSSPVLSTSFILETVKANGKSMPYAVWLPPDYSPAQQWPVILSLHGGYQFGTDGIFPTVMGIGLQLWLQPRRYGGLDGLSPREPCRRPPPGRPSAGGGRFQ
jgi:hypothetical protein